MAKKKQKCRFDSRLILKFRHKRLNEQELEKTEKHLRVCQECRNKLVFILIFEDRIKAEVDNIMLDEDDDATDW